VRADRGVGRDAAGVIPGEAGDDARPHDREERQDGRATADGLPADAGTKTADHRAMDLRDLFFQPRGSMISTTSSMVTVPMSFRRASTTGSASRSYFAMSAATSSFGVVASTFRTCGSISSESFESGFATTRSRRLMTPS